MEASTGSAVLCICGGTIVNHDGQFEADILIENGIITKVEKCIELPKDVKVINASGKLVFPGGVDCDCRLLNPSEKIPVADTFKSGSIAALYGGTTTIINEVPVCPGSSLVTSCDEMLAKISSDICCDFGLTVSVPSFSHSTASQMQTLVAARRVVSFALRLCTGVDTSSESIGLDEETFTEALRMCLQLGILPSVPATGNPRIVCRLAETLVGEFGPEGTLLAIPERLEADTVARAALLADGVCPIFVTRIHSRAALTTLVDIRHASGNSLLFGETSVAAIGIDDGVMSRDWARAAGCISDPPIRPDPKVSHMLLAHLGTGDLTAVGSAHRAVTTAVRAALGLNDFRRIPVGVATIGSRMSALWKCGVEQEAVLDPCSFVAVTSTNAARLFNLYPRKGRIAVGSDADVVVWNTNAEPFEAGMELVPQGVVNPFDRLKIFTCRPDAVVCHGAIVVQEGRPVEGAIIPGSGRLLTCEPFGTFAFGRVEALKKHAVNALRAVDREPYEGPVININGHEKTPPREGHFYRKEFYDNAPKEVLPPGHRVIHTSVKTAQPPGGSADAFWWNN